MVCYYYFFNFPFFYCTVFNLISPASLPPPLAPPPPIWPNSLNRPTRSLCSGVLYNLIPFKANHIKRIFYFNRLRSVWEESTSFVLVFKLFNLEN